MPEEELSEEEELAMLINAKKDFSWLGANYETLLKEHKNEFVAIKNGNIIVSSKKLEDVLSKLKNKEIDPSSTLIKYITDVVRIL